MLFNNFKTTNIITLQYYTIIKYFNLLHIVLTTAVFIQFAIYTVLSGPLGVKPPNNIALLLDSFVRVKI